MNILHVTKSYAPTIGGIETVVKQLAEGMAVRGHKISVLCCAEKNSTDEIQGVTVYRKKTLFNVGSAPVSPGCFFGLRNLIKEQDVIHFHVPNPIGELAYCFSRRNKPPKVVCTYHLDPVRPKIFVKFYKKLLHRFLNLCDVVCPTSPNYMASSDVLSAFKEKCRPIPLGIETPRFTNVNEVRKREAESLVKHLKHPRILFCGRFSYYKGLPFLVEAVSKIQECSLILVGDGEKKGELEHQVKTLGMQNRVVFLGHLPDELYPAIYHAADLFVLPSVYRSEAFGIVGLEAMAAGLPLVTTELGGGTSYYNVDGETGYVVEAGCSESLARAIRGILSAPEKAKEMSIAAKQRVQEFDLAVLVEAYLKQL